MKYIFTEIDGDLKSIGNPIYTSDSLNWAVEFATKHIMKYVDDRINIIKSDNDVLYIIRSKKDGSRIVSYMIKEAIC